MMTTVVGDLLDAPEYYIGHQCNCVTRGQGAGLAKLLFKRFPHANTYLGRNQPSIPGSYSVHGDGNQHRFIVNLYGQFQPGKPKPTHDTKKQRLEWLMTSLHQFVEDYSPNELALPYGIGCGLAGGDWELYDEALKKFAEKRNFPIKLYKL